VIVGWVTFSMYMYGLPPTSFFCLVSPFSA
jgi:hypothetical protein